jgi:hypothetical protein
VTPPSLVVECVADAGIAARARTTSDARINAIPIAVRLFRAWSVKLMAFPSLTRKVAARPTGLS